MLAPWLVRLLQLLLLLERLGCLTFVFSAPSAPIPIPAPSSSAAPSSRFASPVRLASCQCRLACLSWQGSYGLRSLLVGDDVSSPLNSPCHAAFPPWPVHLVALERFARTYSWCGPSTTTVLSLGRSHLVAGRCLLQSRLCLERSRSHLTKTLQAHLLQGAPLFLLLPWPLSPSRLAWATFWWHLLCCNALLRVALLLACSPRCSLWLLRLPLFLPGRCLQKARFSEEAAYWELKPRTTLILRCSSRSSKFFRNNFWYQQCFRSTKIRSIDQCFPFSHL